MYTFRGARPNSAGQSRAVKVCSFPMTTCGSNGWMSGRSHTSATCVKHVFRVFRLTFCAGSRGPSLAVASLNFRFLAITVPLAVPWKRHTLVSSRFTRRSVLPAGTCALRKLHHCQTAAAWGRGNYGNIGPDSGLIFRPGIRSRFRDRLRVARYRSWSCVLDWRWIAEMI